jgi:histidinol dehydrogenase
MLRRIDLRGRALTAPGADHDLRSAVPRADFDVDAALDVVRPICDAVRDRGAEAIAEFSQRFDHVTPPSLRVPPEVLERSLAQLDADVRAALEESVRRLRATCAWCPCAASASTCPGESRRSCRAWS